MHDESGGTEDQRREEARKLIDIIKSNAPDRFANKDIEFVHSMERRLEMYGDRTFISPKQLFYLRDIKDRSL